jgi:hypothetical protein
MFCKVERELAVTVLNVRWQMKLRNKESDIYLTAMIKPKGAWIEAHSCPQVYAPLTGNVVRDDEFGKLCALQRREEHVVHINVTNATFSA